MFKRLKVLLTIIAYVFTCTYSYAAVSVSDGSAFLTKSEMQSNLNDLKNRMAGLENTLDAKIDSLVSAYLTRNGIWNGKKQELSTYHCLTNNVTNTHLYNMYKNQKSANLNVIVDGVPAGKYVLVDGVDKSGLCNVAFETTGTGIAINTRTLGSFSGYVFSGASFTSHDYARDFARYSGTCQLCLYQNDTSVYQTEVISCSTQIEDSSYNGDPAGGYFITQTSMWTPKSLNAYFFVTKDDKIYWNLLYSAVYGEIGTNFNVESLRGSRFGINISKVEVY